MRDEGGRRGGETRERSRAISGGGVVVGEGGVEGTELNSLGDGSLYLAATDQGGSVGGKGVVVLIPEDRGNSG